MASLPRGAYARRPGRRTGTESAHTSGAFPGSAFAGEAHSWPAAAGARWRRALEAAQAPWARPFGARSHGRPDDHCLHRPLDPARCRTAKRGHAGGLENFSGSMDLFSQLGVVAAILVGSTLGAGDLGSGVFRELVVTGRSRLALFAARAPAGLGLVFLFAGAAFAVTATASSVFAGSSEVPGASLLVSSAASLGLVTGLALVLALGVSSALGSRGTTIGILLGWQLIVMPLALQIGVLGSLRGGLVGAATERLEPARLFEGAATVPMSLAAAVVVIAAWTSSPSPSAPGGRAHAMRDAD